jgi:hypothetical protein
MQNDVKRPADKMALQITKPARKAQFVDEDSEDNPVRLADTYTYAFDNLMLVFDENRVSVAKRAELVKSTAGDSKSIYTGVRGKVSQSGHGYQIQLIGGEQAGFAVGQTITMSTAYGVIALYDKTETARLAKDIIAQAEELIG